MNANYYIIQTYGGETVTITFPIIEKIGYSARFFFDPVCQVVDEYGWYGLRCYNDSNISYSDNYWISHFPNAACDTLINEPTRINEFAENENNVECFPNPSSELIFVKSVSAINNIEVYNYCGKLLNHFQHSSNDFTLNIKAYPKGIYILIVMGNNAIIKYFKIIKT